MLTVKRVGYTSDRVQPHLEVPALHTFAESSVRRVSFFMAQMPANNLNAESQSAVIVDCRVPDLVHDVEARAVVLHRNVSSAIHDAGASPAIGWDRKNRNAVKIDRVWVLDAEATPQIEAVLNAPPARVAVGLSDRRDACRQPGKSIKPGGEFPLHMLRELARSVVRIVTLDHFQALQVGGHVCFPETADGHPAARELGT